MEVPIDNGCGVTAEPVEVIKQCMPPGYFSYGADGVAVGTAESASANSAGPLVPGAPPQGTGPTASDPSSPTAGGADDVATNGTDGNASSGDDGSCSFGGAPASSGAGFAGLILGLAALIARRKR